MENRTFWIALVLLALGAGFVFLQPTVEDQLAPTLDRAWVALEAAGTGVAVVGPVEVESGTDFTLHAVVSAVTRSGDTVYYTGAERLQLAGEDIPPEQLRQWDRNRPVKIRWYTIEGRLPFVSVGAGGLSDFRYQSFLRSDWPLAWSIPGSIEPANDDHLQAEEGVDRPDYGTQRYRVQLELYRFKDDLLPKQVVRSWDVEDLRREIEHFPTATVLAGDGTREISRWLGLTQLEPTEEAPEGVTRQIEELARHHIAFSRLTLLRSVVQAAGTSFDELTWDVIDLTGEAAWGSGAAPGDLLRVGDRVVVLYRDLGVEGRVDYQDLCFDFVQGLEVRALRDVFSGEGQAVEIARLMREAP